MRDLIGRTLGHYRIVEKIGEGGMGVVYRAQDERLDRDVAVKVLPEAVAEDPQRLARFEREAKLLASLSHQNVATLHGLEEHDGQRFLVMELAEGETLAERIKKGPIPVDDALDYACQITEGLEAAHEHGIIHRDLKPANVMVSPEGQVKILDFGLAKAWHHDESDADLTHSPTLTAQMTAAGVLLGTAAYMSPEQVRGKPVDRRADIWAFGCVLWEMFTGRKLFEGETVSDLLASVLKEAPDLGSLPDDLPPAVRRLVGRCLEKDARRRLQWIGEARLEIENVSAGQTEQRLTGEGTQPQRRVTWALILLSVLAGAALGALGMWLMQPAQTAREQSVRRFQIAIPPIETARSLQANSLALSPTGSHLVFVGESAAQPGVGRLNLRALDRFEAEPIEGTEGAYGPFFSPDGEWLGYFQGLSLMKRPVRGGPPVRICGAEDAARGGSWTRDGRIFFSPSWFSGVFLVTSDGGERVAVTTLEEDEKSHRFPHVLPDGSAVLFTVSGATTDTFDDASIDVISLRTGERKRLVEGGTAPVYLPSGYLLFGRDGVLLAAPFDAEALELTGPPMPVIDDLVTSPNFGSAQYTVAANGTLAYLQGGPELFNHRIVQISRDGESTTLPLEPRIYTMVRFSPQGNRLAVRVDAANAQLWVFDLERETMSRLTHRWEVNDPIWSPDGSLVAYSLFRGGRSDIVALHTDGTGQPRTLHSGSNILTYAWSPDNRWIVFAETQGESNYDLFLLPVEGDGKVEPFDPTPFHEDDASLSPDGRWLAYRSDRSGRWEVYVQGFPEGGAHQLVSARGGLNPLWSRDGRELFFLSSDRLMAVDVVPGTPPRFGRPRPLLELSKQIMYYDDRVFDAAPDGQSFVTVVKEEGWTPATRVNVVLNWSEELKRLVPTE
jgi:serine/threonine-protein kinase